VCVNALQVSACDSSAGAKTSSELVTVVARMAGKFTATDCVVILSSSVDGIFAAR
jgi:hypothetical protein